jgi:hypothetical protein
MIIYNKCMEKYSYSNEFEDIDISKEDINWLLYGDESEQIIAKLINEENKFKEYINLIGEAFNAENLIMALNIIKTVYEDKHEIYTMKFIQYTPTKEQVERVCHLVNKYNISEFADRYLKERKEINIKILKLKIGIIKASSIFLNTNLIEINNKKLKDIVAGKDYILYSKTLSEFGYEAYVGEYKYLLDKLIKKESIL